MEPAHPPQWKVRKILVASGSGLDRDYIMAVIGGGYIIGGIMERKMETTSLGLRIWDVGFGQKSI